MRRFSIGKLMLLVALVGGYVALSRLLIDAMMKATGDQILPPLLLGLLPMIALQAFAACSVAYRYRIGIARRDRPDFTAAFLLGGLPILAALMLVYTIAPQVFLDQVENAWAPLERGLDAIGLKPDLGVKSNVYGVGPVLFGAVYSGPPLLLATALAAFTSRYRIVFTPRDGATP